MRKTLFDQDEIKKFLEPFEGEKVRVEISTPCLEVIHFRKAIVKINENNFIFKNKNLGVYPMLFKNIRYLDIDESKEYASVTAYLRDNTIIEFTYKNI